MRLLAALVAALALPALAHATLVYRTGRTRATSGVSNDDGSGARRLAAGALPHLSPDGQAVTFVTGIDADNPSLREMPVAGGTAKTILTRWRYGVFAWSPDSRYIAAQAGPLNGRSASR